ncbi:MAG: Na(+)-translocating NADH-quinone reductase subunit A [Pseudomonadota bacterium]
MKQFKLRKGLDLPVAGAPEQKIYDHVAPETVAVLGRDYVGLKPRLSVAEGDLVGAGAPIFFHKDTPSVFITSPVSGRVKAINRGYRRVLISVEIEVDPSAAPAIDFHSTGDAETPDGIAERLQAAGLWTAFRTRPYSKVPLPETRAQAIFVNAMDTEPLAPDPTMIVAEAEAAFAAGLKAVASLSEGSTYVCQAPGANLPGGDIEKVEFAEFSGPHPAGLTGTHLHFLNPPSAERTVWTIGYQDVIAIGHLLLTGRLNSERVVALSGPLVRQPRLIRTLMGASMRELTRGEYDANEPVRLISGSILSGRSSTVPEGDYLGRYCRQITVIKEDTEKVTLGWIRPWVSKFAVQPVLLSSLFGRKSYPMTSNLNGGRRAMVPTGVFEDLMPQDYLPTQLLRALLVMDTDSAQALGALELDEEDLALASYACPAKYEYGMALRDCLTKIEKDG